MRLFLSTIDSIGSWTGRVIGYLVVAVALLITVEITRRYAFNSPTDYAFELTLYMAGTLYLMAGAYAHYLGAHVRVDVLYQHWQPRTRALVDLITMPFFFVFCFALIFAGTKWTWEAFSQGITSGRELDVIIWPVRMMIPLAGFILALQGVAKAIRDFEALLKKEK